MKNVDLLRSVAEDLDAVGVQVVFFGGTVVGLHLDALPEDDEERATTDVDCAPLAVTSSCRATSATPTPASLPQAFRCSGDRCTLSLVRSP